jgi:hypothetical protein
MDSTIAYSVGSFIIILVLLVLLRAKNSRVEVKPSDIVVAVVPVLVFLLVSGKLQKFEVGEGGVKIETAFVKASNSAIVSQVVGLPTESVATDAKAGIGMIPQLVEHKTEGLRFQIGSGSYYGPAIQEYLAQLTKAPFLKYLIVENSDGTFYCIANARELATSLQSPAPPYRADDVARWINTGDPAGLARLPGYVPSSSALGRQADKGQALQKMESANADTLPVVDEKKHFVGVVNRSRLTASLLIDVAKSLEGK